MSRRRRDRDQEATSAKPLSFARPRLLVNPAPWSPPPSPSKRAVEDRRTYHPLHQNRPARQVTGHPVKPHVARQAKPGKKMQLHLPVQVHFAAPKKTLICVRRSTRKEVLFAKGKTHSKKTRRRTTHSNIHC